MDELVWRVAARLDAGWRREDVEAHLAALHRRRRRRTVQRAASAIAIAAIAVAGGALLLRNDDEPRVVERAPVHDVVAPPPQPAVEAPREVVPPEPPPPKPVPPKPAPRPTRDAAVREPTAPAQAPHVEEPAPKPPGWREAAERGDYAGAWSALAGDAEALREMNDLLLAADVARLAGHPRDAVAQLARALDLHAGDPRAPLAAFTLGRVYLEDLGAPRDAAAAFARAFSLAPAGPLAEDALAREVEAWSRAGEATLARTRAGVYLQRYPAGRRVRAVRTFGGVEAP